MIYKNEDGTIYKIEFNKEILNNLHFPDSVVETLSDKEVIEVLNYLLSMVNKQEKVIDRLDDFKESEERTYP